MKLCNGLLVYTIRIFFFLLSTATGLPIKRNRLVADYPLFPSPPSPLYLYPCTTENRSYLSCDRAGNVQKTILKMPCRGYRILLSLNFLLKRCMRARAQAKTQVKRTNKLSNRRKTITYRHNGFSFNFWWKLLFQLLSMHIVVTPLDRTIPVDGKSNGMHTPLRLCGLPGIIV